MNKMSISLLRVCCRGDSRIARLLRAHHDAPLHAVIVLALLFLFPRLVFATNTGRFTISVWVNPTTSIASKAIIAKAEELRLVTDASGNPLCQFKTTTWQTASNAASPLPLNTWSHIVCTYDLVNLKIYVNGVLKGTTALTAVPDDTAAVFYAGRDTSASTTYGLFSGLMDEYKFYNYNLTEDDIKIDYNRGQAIQMGTLSSGAGNTAPYTAASQEYCIPGDTVTCSPPVARWDFNEGVGSTAYDTSGNGNNGGWAGTGTHWATGKVGKAGKFNGTSDYVTVSPINIPTSITIEAWVYSDNFNRLMMIALKKPVNTQWQFFFDAASGGLGSYRVSLMGGSTTRIDTWLDSSYDNKWHQMVATISGSTGTIYIDGILKVTGAVTAIGNNNVTGTNDVLISTYDGVNYPFNGKIDQVRIYNYARSPAQIAWDYNRGAPVAWYKMDECQGTTAHNSQPSTSNLDGSINIGGTAPQTSAGTCTDGLSTSAWYNGASGKYNASLKFDGQDDYVDLGTYTSLDVVSNAFSLSLWVKLASQPASGKIMNFFSKATINFSGFGYGFGYDNRNGIPGLDLYKAGVTDQKVVTTLSTGIWYNIIAVQSFSGANPSSVTYYVNGSSVGSYNNSSAYQSSTGQTAYIGGKSTYTDSVYSNGQLDDVKIFNYALTSQQIKLLYNAGSAVQFAPITGSP